MIIFRNSLQIKVDYMLNLNTNRRKCSHEVKQHIPYLSKDTDRRQDRHKNKYSCVQTTYYRTSSKLYFYLSSVAQSCLTLCDPMNSSTPGLPVHHQLSLSSLKLTSIELVMPSRHLILCHPLLLLPQSLPASESFPMSQLFA